MSQTLTRLTEEVSPCRARSEPELAETIVGSLSKDRSEIDTLLA